MHYYNGQAAAKRIGISYKTLLRWIEKGKIRPEEAKTPTGQLVISGDQVEAARKEVLKERSLFREDEIAIDTSGQPQTEIDMPENLTAKVKALEHEVSELKARVEQLESKKKRIPKTDEAPPEGFVWLTDFCTQHFVPYQAAADLFPHMIRGQNITVGRRNHPVIGPRGRRDFWVQLHTRPDFRACDNCPHLEAN
jgi:polyhydroxyalkanoate synthesis regulator phasin